MNRTIITLAAAFTAGLSLAGNAQATVGHCPNAYYRYEEAGNVGGHYMTTSQYVEASNIRVQRLSCSRARHLARDYAHAYRINYGTPRHLDGFTCRWTRYGDDVGNARCRAGHSFAGFDIYDSSPFH
jgi:hypothetical protein